MNKRNKILKKINKKHIIISVVILIFLVVISVLSIGTILNNRYKRQAEEIKNFEYEIISYTINDDYSYTFDILITIREESGIEKVKYKFENKEELEVNAGKKQKFGVDAKVIENKEYEVKIKPVGKNERTEKFVVKRKSSGTDTYKLVKGIYMNIPFLGDFNNKYTRYLDVKDNNTLTPANWIKDEEPDNWYDYKNQKWANIYVECEGVESYFVWVPRYMYKEDSDKSVVGNERTDVKFVDVYNNYIDSETGEKIEYKELLNQGYKLPEAFEFDGVALSGYWISKYQLSELEYFNINYNMRAAKSSIVVNGFTNNVADKAKKYTYAINGEIKNESETLEDYTFTGLNSGDIYFVNVTALDDNDRIVGSMTKTLEPTEVNAPDVSKFDKDTTFYVYWDDDGIEHNEIPISKEPPKDWYNYTYSNWANIVTRSNGMETYYVWVPRYQFKINETSQRTDVKFILGTGTTTETGYAIPEAFEFGGQQLTGYWITKYQLSIEENTPNINAEMSAGSSIIRVLDITGTKVTNDLKYEYYLDGELKYEGDNSTEHYAFEGLTANTTYIVNIIARNKTSNAYVGAVTKKVKTIEANAPDISKFDKETTFYVTYDSSGNPIRTSIKEEAPSNWYDYSNQKWANIVTTANGTTSYWVWVPRYEFRILGDRDNLSTANRRIEVNFLSGTETKTTQGYSIPEAFEFGGQKLTGYWIAKYQLST